MTNLRTYLEEAVKALMNNPNCFSRDTTMIAEDRQRQRIDIMREACVMTRLVHEYEQDPKVLDYLDPSRVTEREMARAIREGTGRRTYKNPNPQGHVAR